MRSTGDRFLLSSLIVMSFSLLGLKAYENQEDPAILGAIGMMVLLLLVMLFCMYAEGRDARRHTNARCR